MSFNFELVVQSFPLLMYGVLMTLKITSLSVGIGLIIGLLLSVARLSTVKLARWFAIAYVEIIRGTPLLVQIFIIYFALPSLIHHRVDAYYAAVAACGINSGAYVAEILRAGLQSVDKGQMEAGRSLGLSWFQTMKEIIVPQAFKNVIPALGNEFIAMLKDSSLVSVIGYEELMRSGQLIIARTYATTEIWSVVALLYLIMTFTISRIVGYIERRLNNA